MEYLTCQFCGETDFDLEGLWFHYDARNCEEYRKVGLMASGMDLAQVAEETVTKGENT